MSKVAKPFYFVAIPLIAVGYGICSRWRLRAGRFRVYRSRLADAWAGIAHSWVSQAGLRRVLA